MAEPYLLSSPEDFFISADVIQTRVAEMGAELASRFDGQDVTLLTVLNGAAPFAHDLKQYLHGVNVTEDTIDVKSYVGTESTGALTIKKPLDSTDNITGKRVIVVEDMLDTGLTLSVLTKWLRELGPKSLDIVSLIEKPDGRVDNTEIDAPVEVGFQIAKKFVVGYGLDYNDEYRELPYITICKQQPDGLWTPQIPDELALAA